MADPAQNRTAIDQPQEQVRLAVAELMTVVLVVIAAAIIITAYCLDVLGWPINPALMVGVLLIEIVTVLGIMLRHKRWPRVVINGPGLAGFLFVTVGLLAYLSWLAGPAWLPPTQSSDLVHHLSLIDFIQQRQMLPHDPALPKYLGEMGMYPAGSHILAAVITGWFGTIGLSVIFPVLAGTIVVKVGLLYNTALHLTPTRRHPALVIAGVSLLLFAWNYFFIPITWHFYYGQVVAEMFTIAMLWATVRFDARPSSDWLWFSSLCGAALALTWTVWLPIPLLTLLIVIARQSGVSIRTKLEWVSLSVLPLIGGGWLYITGYLGNNLAIFVHEGAAVLPSIESYSPWLLTFAAIGLIGSWRNRRARSIRFMLSIAFLQAVVLFCTSLVYLTGFYWVWKVMHILIYPMALFAALAFDGLWNLPARRWPMARGQRWARLAMILPVAVIGCAAIVVLPPVRPPSAVSDAAYEAGQWAKANLSNTDCVDYIADHWVTAYWLHIAVLGNPRLSPHTDAIVADWNYTQSWATRWRDADGLPFAIVADLTTVPDAIRAHFNVLYTSGQAAVVQRIGQPVCGYIEAPIDHFTVAPRPNTVAAFIESALHR